MNRCLGDRILFLIGEGEGSQAHRAHLAGCPHCRERSRQIARAGVLAARVLREGPLPDPVQTRAWIAPRWLVPSTAALALAVTLGRLALPGGGFQRETTVPTDDAAQSALSLNEVSNAVFAFDESEWRSADDSESELLQTAMLGEFPCDSTERLLSADCE